MTIVRDVSDRFLMLRFPLVVGVVVAHAYSSTIGLESGVLGVSDTGFVAAFIREFISRGLCRVAIPLYFMMSGYFYFSWEAFNRQEYDQKLRKRLWSLFVPFLIWNLSLLLALLAAQSLGPLKPFFSGYYANVAEYTPLQYFTAVFGIGRLPISYQFWFIRDLIVLVMISPILYWLFMRLPWFLFPAVFAGWLYYSNAAYTPVPEAVLFFCVGGWMRRHGTTFQTLDRYGPVICAGYLALVVADVLTKSYWFSEYYHKITLLPGSAAALWMAGRALRHARIKAAIFGLAASSFFVFAAHEPLLTVVRKFSYKLLMPERDATVLFLYFLDPLLVIGGCTAAYFVLRRIMPRFTDIITGGR